MIDLNDAAFYLRRERQERLLASRAQSAAIGAIHAEMAERYASLAEQARALSRRLHLA